MGAARHRGRHRNPGVASKPRAAARHEARRAERQGRRQRDRLQRRDTAARSVRPLATTAAVALMATTVLAGAPAASAAATSPSPSEVRTVSANVDLTANSLLWAPINLAIDLINIPHSEAQAVDLLARAQLFAGPWFVVGPTNVWGIDQGDIGRFQALVDLLAPFPALNGINLGQSDGNGLSQQVWQFIATQLPTSAFCEARGCMPTVPNAPITGIAAIDSSWWSNAVLTGQVKFPLLNNWYQVPISKLTDGSFVFDKNYPGYYDAEGADGQVYPGLGFPGTTPELQPDGTYKYVNSWANTSFTFNPLLPFKNYFQHLMSNPFQDASGNFVNPIKLPKIKDFLRSLQTLAAGLVMFTPFSPGSFSCLNACAGMKNDSKLNYPAIIKFIDKIWPGNQDVHSWVTAYDNGTANVPNQHLIDAQIALYKASRQFWDYGNPSPPDDWYTGTNYNDVVAFYHNLWTKLGLHPPPCGAVCDGPIPDTGSPIDPQNNPQIPQSNSPTPLNQLATPKAGSTATENPSQTPASLTDETQDAKGTGTVDPAKGGTAANELPKFSLPRLNLNLKPRTTTRNDRTTTRMPKDKDAALTGTTDNSTSQGGLSDGGTSGAQGTGDTAASDSGAKTRLSFGGGKHRQAS